MNIFKNKLKAKGKKDYEEFETRVSNNLFRSKKSKRNIVESNSAIMGRVQERMKINQNR